jgi:hypothetical protein
MTLIELLLVIALLAMIATSVVPNLGRVFRVGVQASMRQFGSLVRYTYDQSILTGRIHRILLDLDTQRWEVQIANPGLLPLEKTEEQLRGRDTPDDDEIKKRAAENEKAFKPVGGRLVAAIPKGVRLVRVSSWRFGGKDRPVDKGQVYIYAYPSGFVDDAQVVLAEEGKDQIQRFEINIEPLTGRIRSETVTGNIR